MTIKVRMIVAGATLLGAASAALGDGVNINPFDRGWVTSAGVTNGAGNYFAGQLGGEVYRNWFTFDLSSISGDVTSAELIVSLNPVVGVVGTDVYLLRASNISVDDLVNRVGGASLFNAMDDEAVIASFAYDSSMNGMQITITFNSVGLDLLEAHAGGELALVGNISDDLQALTNGDGIFGASNDISPLLAIEFTPFASAVPLPSAAGLGVVGLLGLGARRRRC